jgi:ABC-type antimicrobial peptide transport system permease subunit
MVLRRRRSNGGCGIAAGLLLSLAVTRLARTFLYGMEPDDPATLALSAIALVTVACPSAILPAWPAARLDPAMVLRDDRV